MKTKKGNETNQLINEKSPYLLQHAHNPVDWYPWQEEAFQRAKKEDKPIFLSIGYSTCHWCHVMARESFNDREVADYLNKYFISIKVDREERPEIDDIYMQACRLMTGSGGWPLSVFMTADKKPFYIGTYFPKTGNYGRPGFLDLLKIIDTSWQENREKILSSAGEITEALQQIQPETSAEKPDNSAVDKAYSKLKENYDPDYGGFGSAPKFPMPHQIIFLLHYWHETGQSDALSMAEKTLLALRSGGIYDQLGYGFHRYSTDRKWLLPHFEKMLYDQALHTLAYTEAYQATGKKLYARVIKEISSYLQEKLLSPEGGFYSAEDADSEGVEGKYYLWTEEEIRDILPPGEAEKIIELFNIRSEGNFRSESGENNNRENILHLENPQPEINKILLESKNHRQLLYKEREKRIKPDRDNKILTDWNGLMIAALARAGWVLEDNVLIKLAADAAHFIDQRLRDNNGNLLHRYCKGEASFQANLNDYVFLTRGMIELYQATFRPEYLLKALDLTQQIIQHFEDREKGGFYFTPEEGEKMITRQKKIEDGALPSGNSMAIWNLNRLSLLTGKKELQAKAKKTATTFYPQIKTAPSHFSQYLISLTAIFAAPAQLVLSGKQDDLLTEKFLYNLRKIYSPRLAVIFKPEENPDQITDIAPFTAEYKMINGRTTAYVCKNYSCSRPTNDPEEMASLLSGE